MSTRILAIDTATEACSVALWNDGEINALYEICPRDHTKLILPMVQKVLTESGVGLTSLDALAFGRGPGSFTGVRIGIGVAQGLALGANLPMIPVSTLKTMAQGAWRVNACSQVLAAIDARMGEVYWGAFIRRENGEWDGVGIEAVLSPDAAAERLASVTGQWATAGTGWETYPDLAAQSKVTTSNSTILLPDAQDMLPLALHAWAQGETVSVELAEPIYLRNEVTWKKLPGR